MWQNAGGGAIILVIHANDLGARSTMVNGHMGSRHKKGATTEQQQVELELGSSDDLVTSTRTRIYFGMTAESLAIRVKLK